eukprot:m.379320 g.379320  ORF g.379320 m.379320 type:complete len:56 (+) comp97763_c0_seq1:58-225(+)
MEECCVHAHSFLTRKGTPDSGPHTSSRRQQQKQQHHTSFVSTAGSEQHQSGATER